MWSKIPTWTKVIFGLGVAGGGSAVVKQHLAGPDFDVPVQLNGKVAVVTGANTGIGFEVAKSLAARGARVYLACRDKDRCAEAREDIFLATDNKDIHCRYCDLASFESVKRFVRRIHKDEEKIDILINNAGVWADRKITPEGIELQLGVNHMGHFLLTNLLIDKLKQGVPSRIVNVTCTSYKKGKINVTDLNSAESFSKTQAYNQSKLCNVLFTKELAKRLEGTGVTANAVNPGVVDTEIARNSHSFTKVLMLIMKPLVWAIIKSPWQGAQAVLHVALHPDLENTSGQYFNLREIEEPSGDASNDKLAVWLWLTSEKWTKLQQFRDELNVAPLTLPGVPSTSIALPDLKQKAKHEAFKAVHQDIKGNFAGSSLPS